MISLGPILPIPDVKASTDRFRCEPYEIDIFARTCVGRQGEAREMGRVHARTSSKAKCYACPDGRKVAGNIGAVLPDRVCAGPDGCDRTPGEGEIYCEWHRRGRKLDRAASNRARLPRLSPETLEAMGNGEPKEVAMVASATGTTKQPRVTATWTANRCTHPGCSKLLRPGKFKGPPPAGAETLCKEHRDIAAGIVPIRQRCTEAGCGVLLRLGRLKAAPPAGTETLCTLHRKRYLSAHRPPATHEERNTLAEIGRLALVSPTDGAVLPSCPSLDLRVTPAGRLPAESVARALAEFAEAHHLVSLVGWDVVRSLAARIQSSTLPSRKDPG